MWQQSYESLRSLGRSAPMLRRILPHGMVDSVRRYLLNMAVTESPDRRFMEKAILPALAAARPARLLFVGCQRYTRHYGQWFADTRTEFWTIDYDPDVAIYGSKGRHVTGSVTDLGQHFENGYFDIIIMSGVIGFGLNESDDIKAGLQACRNALCQDGILLLGWNQDRSPDPLETMAILKTSFVHGSYLALPSRKTFTGCFHVYDLFKAV